MNIAMQKHSPYLVFFFILPSLILLLIAFSNLLSTFSYSNYQIGFYIISFITATNLIKEKETCLNDTNEMILENKA